MKPAIATLFLLTACCLPTGRSVQAFPNAPYSGSASAQAVDIDLDLGMLGSAAIDVSVHEASLGGAEAPPLSPATTSAQGDGIDVQGAGPLNIASVNADVVNSSTTKTYDGDPTAVTDFEAVLSSTVDSSLILVPAAGGGGNQISSMSSSQVTSSIADSNGASSVNDLSVFADTLQTVTLLDAGQVYASSSSRTEAVSAEHDVESEGSASLNFVDISLGAGPLSSIVTADVVTTMANTAADGVNGSATTSVEVVNLVINGVAQGTITASASFGPFTVAGVTFTVGVGVNDHSDNDPTNSSAGIIGLRVAVSSGPIANTVIDLAAVSANSVADTVGGNVGPTPVYITDFSAVSGGSGRGPGQFAILVAAAALALGARAANRPRRRGRFSRSDYGPPSRSQGRRSEISW